MKKQAGKKKDDEAWRRLFEQPGSNTPPSAWESTQTRGAIGAGANHTPERMGK